MKAAFNRIHLNPPIGAKMAGFSERDHGAEGIHDPITGSVFLLDDGKTKAAIVSLDVIAVDAVLVEEVGKRVEALTEIKKENILIGAIHTHSSIDATRIHGIASKIAKTVYSEEQIEYYHQLIETIVKLIVEAEAKLVEAKLGYGTSICQGLGTNRNDPKAYYDSTVYMLKAVSMQGDLIGLLVSHACHPTVLNHFNYQFTADYVGAFRETMQDILHKEVVMFLQGPAGSASCRYTRKGSTFADAKSLSHHLSAAVLDQMDQIEVNEGLMISSVWSKLTLPVKDYGEEQTILAQIEDYQNKLKALKQAQAPESEIRRMYVTLQGAQRNLAAKRNNTYKEIEAQIQILDLGICAITALPGDVFAEIGRDVCALMDKPCFAAGYANDFIGYIVSKEGYQMDCYERNLSYFDHRAHDLIVQQFKAMIEKETQEA